MLKHFDLIVRGGTIVTAERTKSADVGIVAGRFAEIGDLSRADADGEIEAKGLHILPGVIDTQVHFREPGLEGKEDLASGTAAAAMGGVTAIFEMPNTNPPTTNAEALANKFSRARGRAWVDHAFFVGATAENASDLAFLEQLPGCCGVKIFMGSSTGTLLVADDKALMHVLRSGKRRSAIHAEDEQRLKSRHHLAAAGDVSRHPVWRDVETARLATERIIRLARDTDRPIHVLHVTTAEEMALLRAAKDIATVECTPQHLTFEAPDCYDRLGTRTQMNPPIRGAEHRTALWRAVADNTVNVIGSDHAPHTLEEKAQPYPQSPSGMPGVQTLLPIMLDHVHANRLSLNRLVDLTSAGAARIYGIANKGSIAIGNDADLSLVDLSRRQLIEDSWIVSKCGWTPYDGMTVTGWPIATIIRGHLVMRDGALVGNPSGEPVSFSA